MLSRQYEKQRIFLKEKRTFEPDSFLPQATRKYIYERTPYSLCSLGQTTHLLLANGNTGRSCQKQSGTHSGKCAPTTTTHHPRAFSTGCSGLETSALPRSTRYIADASIVSSSACIGSADQRPLLTSPRYPRKPSP